MNTFAKSILVATALLGFGASGAMAATTPAQCYATKAAANLNAYRSAVGVCNSIAGAQSGALGSAAVNASIKGPSGYAAFRAAVSALGVSVPAATAAELANAGAWNNYVRRVAAAALSVVESKYAACTRTAETVYAAANAAAKKVCGA